jgi:hypothetical protein
VANSIFVTGGIEATRPLREGEGVLGAGAEEGAVLSAGRLSGDLEV